MVDLQAIVAVIAGAAGGTALTATNVRTVREAAKDFSDARELILRVGDPVLIGGEPGRWETAHQAVKQRVTDWVNHSPRNGDV